MASSLPSFPSSGGLWLGSGRGQGIDVPDFTVFSLAGCGLIAQHDRPRGIGEVERRERVEERKRDLDLFKGMMGFVLDWVIGLFLRD